MPGFGVGQIVHYILPIGPSAGQHRPAIIVRVWTTDRLYTCQLQVFTDGRNDGMDNVTWATSVPYDESGENSGSWHWPEAL